MSVAILLHVLVTDTAVRATHQSLQGRHVIITLHAQGNGGVVGVQLHQTTSRGVVINYTVVQEACLFPCLSWWAPPPPQLAVVGQRGQDH